MYSAAEYSAAAADAMGEYEDEIRQAEIMLDARGRQLAHEEIIIEADEVIEKNAAVATATLLEKGLVDSKNGDQIKQLIARAWSSSE
jgi:hypothetical protein